MREHVRAFIRTCPCCQKMNVLKTPIHCHPFTTSTYELMVCLNIDFVGPFSDGGYILIIIDTFTRWVELYVCESADAQEAARCLFKNSGRFGALSQILSDRGSHFVNYVVMEFLSYCSSARSNTASRGSASGSLNSSENFYDVLIIIDYKK